MTREELLKTAKPILFNHGLCDIAEYPEANIDGLCANFYDNEHFYKGCAKPPYKVGDYLYVRETWARVGYDVDSIWFEEPEKLYDGQVIYRTDFTEDIPECRWHPSIHMPKEAARIFLRVTDVRVERLQDITDDQAIDEGCKGIFANVDWVSTPREEYVDVWNSTVKKSDLDRYGWDANPWVWVIEFERVEVEP